ncbi:MAG TPA: carbamoyltransferase HypF [Ilumatobacteraceae bacterium]
MAGAATTRERLRVTGTVQGVGFRPFVYRHAVALGLTGYVLNDSAGVLIDVQGAAEDVAELTRLLVDDAPPLARVAGVVTERLQPSHDVSGFRIVESHDAGSADVPVSIDTAACVQCLAEIDDPSDRRYGYAFTNCTNCGPRYTIVLGVPYDRPATTMAGFEMCPACRAEYEDPADRRFHAQPNACPACGPQLRWRSARTAREADAPNGSAALNAAIDAINAGDIVAVKGIGGYHLVADAANGNAIVELRRRKARDDKPFAVMVASLAAAHELCNLDEAAAAALTSIRRPIVLAPRRHGSRLAAGVAPGLAEVGLMLPYSPLHHLLLTRAARPLVMTSGNVSDEPIAHHDDDAASRLASLVDGFLHHDRPIHIRCDDSVVRATPMRLQIIRRSRGYAPERLNLPFTARREVLAVGAELKSTVSVAKQNWVVPSHHIGDLEHLATYRSFVQAIDHLPRLYGVTPQVVAHDMHPEYLSSKWAEQVDLPTVAVQHHHAHVAACMVEHGRTAPVLGIAYDGLGYGPDGSLWGGEMLVADYSSSRRVARLRPVRMPGGVAAIREPWRMAATWGAIASGEDDARRRAVDRGIDEGAAVAVLALAQRTSSPLTTSVGRLFDAVAAMLGGRQRVSYEAQAAIELEALARTVERGDSPTYDGCAVVTHGDGTTVLDPGPLLAAMLADIDAGADRALIAAGFHEAFGAATATLATQVAAVEGLDTVCLTGGVFQNARLTEVVESHLREAGLAVLVHSSVPPNDGGVSIGQAAVAAFAPG